MGEEIIMLNIRNMTGKEIVRRVMCLWVTHPFLVDL